MNYPNNTTDSEAANETTIDPEGYPLALRERSQWGPWRRELRDDKVTKIPYDPHTGYRVSVSDPSTWGTFDEAVSALHEGTSDGEPFNGVGYFLSEGDPFTVIDVDKGFDPKCFAHLRKTDPNADWRQATKDWFRPPVPWLARVSYVDLSQSGRGLHFVTEGTFDGDIARPVGDGKVQYFQKSRFIAHNGTGPDDRMTAIDPYAESNLRDVPMEGRGDE